MDGCVHLYRFSWSWEYQPVNPPPPPGPAPDARVRVEVYSEAGAVRVGEGRQIGPMMEALSRARRAASLRATADTVRLNVGELVQAKDLPLVMIDSAGVELGPLPTYDIALRLGGFVELHGAGLRGVRAGVQPVTFRVPKLLRGDRTDPQPSATIYFAVQPTQKPA